MTRVGRFLFKSVEDHLRFLESLPKYRRLLVIPDPKFVTHGTTLRGVRGILKNMKIIHSPEEGRVYFSMDSIQWGACTFVFDFWELKEILDPVFYFPDIAFTIFYNNFGLCIWEAVCLTEVSIKGDLSLDRVLFLYLPPLVPPPIEREAKKAGVPVKRVFRTPLKEWCDLARDFYLEVSDIVEAWGKVLPPYGYLPKFVDEYNRKVHSLFPHIRWEEVLKRWEEYRMPKELIR